MPFLIFNNFFFEEYLPSEGSEEAGEAEETEETEENKEERLADNTRIQIFYRILRILIGSLVYFFQFIIYYYLILCIKITGIFFIFYFLYNVMYNTCFT